MDTTRPAVAALRRAGYSPERLSAVLGRSRTELVAELTGRRVLSGETLDALRGLLAPHKAEAVAAAAGRSRAAYLLEVQAGRM